VSGIPTGYAPGEVYTTGAATGVAFGKLIGREACRGIAGSGPVNSTRRSVRFVTYTPAFQAACCTMAEMLASVYDCDAGGVIAGGRPTELSTSPLYVKLSDDRAVTKGEVLALELARAAGINASQARVIDSDDVPVALIHRFDRPPLPLQAIFISARDIPRPDRYCNMPNSGRRENGRPFLPQ
jgi:hypothetical protein